MCAKDEKDIIENKKVNIKEAKFTSKLKMRVNYRGKSNKKIGKRKRPSFEFKGGDEFSVDRDKYVKRHYYIDRENNIYTEKISDADTGEVILEKKENLHTHTGNGSDNKNK